MCPCRLLDYSLSFLIFFIQVNFSICNFDEKFGFVCCRLLEVPKTGVFVIVSNWQCLPLNSWKAAYFFLQMPVMFRVRTPSKLWENQMRFRCHAIVGGRTPWRSDGFLICLVRLLCHAIFGPSTRWDAGILNFHVLTERKERFSSFWMFGAGGEFVTLSLEFLEQLLAVCLGHSFKHSAPEWRDV